MEKKEKVALALAAMIFVLGALAGWMVHGSVRSAPHPWACLTESADAEWLYSQGTLRSLEEAIRARVGVSVISFSELWAMVTTTPENLVGKEVAVLMDYFPLGGCLAVDVVIYSFERVNDSIQVEKRFVALVFDRRWNEIHRTEYAAPN